MATIASRYSPTTARIALAIPAAILLAALGWLNYSSKQKLSQIDADGVTVQGQVAGKNCNNHGEIIFSYAADKRNYTNTGFCPVECATVPIGTQIAVTYSKSNPSISRCESAVDAKGHLGGSYLALALLAIGLSVVIYRITRTR